MSCALIFAHGKENDIGLYDTQQCENQICDRDSGINIPI